MKRRQFLKSTAAASVIGMVTGGVHCFGTTPFDVTFDNLPLWRGFNLQEKFTHKPDEWLSLAPEWGFKNEPFRESDFETIRELGFNFVRLPMSYKCWCDENNWYNLQEKHLKEIDQAVEWGRQYGLHVCINFHRAPGFTIGDENFEDRYREKTSVWDDDAALKACAFHWRHFAERYKGVPNSRVSFNLFNEPTGTTEEKHDRVIRYLVDEIGSVDPSRLIVIDGFNTQPSVNLAGLKVSQCARGYMPGIVTHYKTTWWTGNDILPTWPMKDSRGELWDKSRLLKYYEPWREIEKRGVGVYVGEFGVYNLTPHEVTLAFLKDNLEIWKEQKWGWAMWCFRGSFGVADSGRRDVKYENYRGLKLDRKMVELLSTYLK